jgi:hypothetical protein
VAEQETPQPNRQPPKLRPKNLRLPSKKWLIRILLGSVAKEDVTGKFYLEVKEGQFLKLRHGTISQEE